MTLIIFVSLVTSEQACWFVLTITFGDQLDQWIPWRSLGKGESYVIEAKLFFEQLISKSVSKPALGVAILNKKEQLSFLFLNVNCCAIFRTLLHAAHAHGFDCHVLAFFPMYYVTIQYYLRPNISTVVGFRIQHLTVRLI